MKTIWKYTLDVTTLQLIEIPSDFEVLSVQCQNNVPCVWIIVDPDSEKIGRLFEIKGTGHELEDKKRTFLGTFQTEVFDLVFHVFLRDSK